MEEDRPASNYSLPCDRFMMVYYKTLAVPAVILWGLYERNDAKEHGFCQPFRGPVQYAIGMFMVLGLMCVLASAARDYNTRSSRWTSIWVEGMGKSTLALFRLSACLVRLVSNLMMVLVTICFLSIKIMCLEWVDALLVFLMILALCLMMRFAMALRKLPREVTSYRSASVHDDI